jgi:hypothetical protein
LIVSDLKSANGTKVNDEPVSQHALGDGDHIAFGHAGFRVERRYELAWRRWIVSLSVLLASTLLVIGGLWLAEYLDQAKQHEEELHRLRDLAVDSAHEGIEAVRSGDRAVGRARLLYAADLFLFSGLAPKEATLERPETVFQGVRTMLQPEDRDFDFADALTASNAGPSLPLTTLSDDEYVRERLRQYAAELGQDDRDIPPGFYQQVRFYVHSYVDNPQLMRTMLQRATTLQPKMRAILAAHHLPESFCYVAWVESNLILTVPSPKGAVGLWQFMPEVAREYHLRVEPGLDDRTDADRSTEAAAEYFSRLLRNQGPEYIMLVLASYNHGPGAVEKAKQQVQDPMLKAQQKYWYLVEHQLLPKETQAYVPKIFAVRMIAEEPSRFHFQVP